MNKKVLLFVMMLLPMCAWAQEEPTYFTSTTGEGVEVSYYILSSESSYCIIGGKANGWGMPTNAINTATQGILTIPETVQYNNRTLGVVRVDINAFNGCNKLTSVTLPDNMAGIGLSAFESCYNLTSIKMPKRTTAGLGESFENDFYIGSSAFNNCYKLTEIELPEGLKELLSGTFSGCSKLNTVSLPSTLTRIESSAFFECESLTSVSIKASVPPTLEATAFDDVSGITLYVPKGSKGAYSTASYWSNFKEIIEDASLHVINFEDENAKAICVSNWDTNGDGELDEGEAAAVTDIGSVFKWQYDVNEGPSYIKTFNEFKYFTGLTTIGEEAFYGCSSLTSITLPNTFKRIGNNAFWNCTKLSSIGIPNSVGRIDYLAFRGCSSLISLTIPESVYSIGYAIVSGCNSLASIVVDANNPSFSSPDNCNAIIDKTTGVLIAGCKNSVIPSGTIAIGFGAFEDCGGLTSVVMPSSVVKISNSAFKNCNNLETLTLSSSLLTIQESAFNGCKKLSSITIPSTVTTIGSNAFNNCSSVITIIVENGNTVFDSRDNCNAIIKTETNTLIRGCQSSTIPNTVKTIEANAFQNVTNLKSIVIPSSVTTIGSYAFYGCVSLEIVKSKIITPFTIEENVFQYQDKSYKKLFTKAKLLVPNGCKALYQSTNCWNKFTEIEEQLRCATPTIKLIGGKLHFECETEGVEYHYEFTASESGKGTGNDISITPTYAVKVYASKPDFTDSEEASLDINAAGIKGDTNQDGKVTISDAVGVVNIILNNGEATAPALQDEEEIKEPE